MDDLELDQETAFLGEMDGESLPAMLGFEPEGEPMFEEQLFGEEGLGEGDLYGEPYFEGSDGFDEENFSFKGAFRAVAPMLKPLAKKLLPVIGTAVLGPAGGVLGGLASKALGEEGYGDYESSELRSDFEATLSAPITPQQAIASTLTNLAANAASESEAGAHVGAAVVLSLTPEQRQVLGDLLPALLKGASTLMMALRSDQRLRVMRPVVPAVITASAKTLAARAASGQPLTRRDAAVVISRNVNTALRNPSIAARAIRRNTLARRKVAATQTARRRQYFA